MLKETSVIKVSSGGKKTVREIMDMQDGPMKKFWLLAVAVSHLRIINPDEARKLSCQELIYVCDMQKFGRTI